MNSGLVTFAVLVKETAGALLTIFSQPSSLQLSFCSSSSGVRRL
jgi:hypothetical protein